MRLKDWVRAQPGTVGEVAIRLGLKRVALHRAMRGQTFPRGSTRSRIAEATRDPVSGAPTVTVDDLSAEYNEFWEMAAGATA